ncbi:MAG: ribosome maturation factor RimP [Clostridiales Family XIII bacterium]|jgi:ribosome maturation factor RimP|nr:ribosome maturation factor RimP [Clostridiales Family XIII bacterium]
MSKKNIIQEVKNMLEPFAVQNHYEIWNMEFVKAGKDYNLNIYIDKEGGISTADCELVSRHLEGLLDEADLIEQNYYLIVSSPGMDRPLLTDAHFVRYEGAPVEVMLYKGFEGSKHWLGTLKGRTEEALHLVTSDGQTLSIPRELVSKVKLQIIF